MGTSLKLHAAYVVFWALTCFLMKWDHLGSMFGNPPEPATAEAATEAKGSQKEDGNSESQGGPQKSDLPKDMPADKKSEWATKQDILDLRNEIVGLRDDLGLTKASAEFAKDAVGHIQLTGESQGDTTKPKSTGI